jgi:hypothetical protein
MKQEEVTMNHLPATLKSGMLPIPLPANIAAEIKAISFRNLTESIKTVKKLSSVVTNN